MGDGYTQFVELSPHPTHVSGLSDGLRALEVSGQALGSGGFLDGFRAAVRTLERALRDRQDCLMELGIQIEFSLRLGLRP